MTDPPPELAGIRSQPLPPPATSRTLTTDDLQYALRRAFQPQPSPYIRPALDRVITLYENRTIDARITAPEHP